MGFYLLFSAYKFSFENYKKFAFNTHKIKTNPSVKMGKYKD